VKGCGDKLRAPSPTPFDSGDRKMKSKDITDSPEATGSKTAAGVPLITAEMAAVHPEKNTGTGPHVMKEVPEPLPRHDRTPPPGLPAKSLSPRQEVLPLTATAQNQLLKDEAMDSVCSQTPRSDLGSVTTETFLDERKSRIIECVVRDVTKRIKAMFLQARGGPNQTSNPSTSDKAPTSRETGPNSARSTDGKKRNLKRKLHERNNGDTDEDDEGTSNGAQKDTDGPEEENPGYACPYFKYNPSLYKSARGCPGPGWPNVHRVKY